MTKEQYFKRNNNKNIKLLKEKSEEFNNNIFIISDEPYREIVYDDIKVPYVTKYYNNTLVCYSFFFTASRFSLPGKGWVCS